MASERKTKQKKQGPALLEWLAGALGGFIAIGMIVFISLEALQPGSTQPPLLHVRPTGLTAGQGVFVVEVEASNRSGQSAAAVELLAELKQGGSIVETANATISYVPGHSKRSAGVVFRRDPRQYQFVVRALGYEKP